MRTNLNAKERAYVERARVCHVGSVGKDGFPHGAPVSAAYDGKSRTLYFATDRGGRTATNLRARPRASVALDDYSENWNGLHGIMLRARARKLERGKEFEHSVELLKKKFRQYRPMELDYIVALKVESVVASWGLSGSR
ncbi:MAG TPA: pyridoxamine 5'-phosphate oxidase family protein [Actinomycetota bacterium]|nr:pyridoxamine 5'-phosphate oxidase family protein [Actinomycetota bacterium]